MIPTEPSETPATEAVHEVLGRILRSDGFSGSAQLCRFLRHVVVIGLEGERGQLKESTIGVSVFNRGPGYDPKTDPIVRVEARRLRSRLEQYYSGAGADDRVRIQLPKGGYTPTFEIVSVAAPEPEAAPTGLNPTPRRPLFVATLAAAAITIFAVLWMAGVGQSPDPVRQFWDSLLRGDRPAMLVPADSGLVMLQDITHERVQISDYVTGEYRDRRLAQGSLPFDLTQSLSGRRYTSIADLEFATRLARRKEASPGGVLTRFARDLRVEDLKANNLLFLGARHSNPWVELFEKEATFRLEHDEKTSVFTVRNMLPGPGEPATIVLSPVDLKERIYGIVTFHANRYGAGKVLVVAGTSVAGTEAASDFLMNDAELLPWLKKAAKSGHLRGFDILLFARNLSGSAPRAEVLAFHPEK